MTEQLVWYLLGSAALGALLVGAPAIIALVRLKAQNKELRRQVELDQMTGTYNKPAALKRLQRHMERARHLTQQDGIARQITVLFADVDRLGMLNDLYTHEGADQIIVHVAKLLSSLVRPEDIVGRMGGDEFVFILPETGEDGGKRVGMRIHRELRDRPIMLRPANGDEEEYIPITVSTGGVVWTSTEVANARLAYRQASAIMKEVKARGKRGDTGKFVEVVDFVNQS